MSQLTHLFNVMTPHLQTTSQLSVLFSSVQKDDKMSRRQAEPITESAAAKQRPVRILCAYAPHAASSSPSSSANSWLNRAGRDHEQETNRPDSSVQKSQSSDADKTILSGTEKSIVMRYEESESPNVDPQNTRRSQ